MLKTVSKLELKISERDYQFMCDPESPIEHVKEALFQFQKHVGQLEDAIKSAQEQAKSNEKSNMIEEIVTDIAPEVAI